MKNTFRPTWESIRTHEIPEWYHDCKLGIFIHWGLYSVPAFATPTAELGKINNEEWFTNNPYAEWYYNSLKLGSGATYEHHIKPMERILNMRILQNSGKLRNLIQKSGRLYFAKLRRAMSLWLRSTMMDFVFSQANIPNIHR